MEFDLNVALGLEDPFPSRSSTDPKSECNKNESDCDDEEKYESAEAKENKKVNVEADVDAEAHNTHCNTTCAELEEKLKVGVVYPDLENIYLLYCEYARWKGFSVRKGEQRYFGRSNDIRWKEFICSCTGLPNEGSLKRKVGVYRKLITRSDCRARVVAAREDLAGFVVISFEKAHNHILVPPDQTYLLRSSRSLNYAKKSVLEALNSVGIGISRAYKFIEKESGGVQNVGFLKKDGYHHMDRVRKETKLEDGDSRSLFEYFTNKANENPFFFWKYQLDDDGRLLNVFFRDARCAVDYEAFGDVMSVDTTYRTNKYELICAPFVGINHHTSNVMFGMALLSDETTPTFKWLFEIFLESMNGKQPTVIFTDQCKTMMNAIDITFPKSKHRLCQWHISKNCCSNFGKLNGSSSFKSLWYKCMNIVETEEEFLATWKEIVGNPDIHNPGWYDAMYNLHHRWASCFTRGVFTGGLLATSRSELTNKVLKDVVGRTTALTAFVRQYEDILKSWRTTERADDTLGLFVPKQVTANSGLLAKAASVYTCRVYKQLEFDYANCATVIVNATPEELPDNCFRYTALSRDRLSFERKVVFNKTSKCATCDCGKWETEGLICQHILKVFFIENIDDIPDSMILRRWTKRAKHPDTRFSESVVGEESSTMRQMTVANELMRHMYEMVTSSVQHDLARAKLVERMKQLVVEFSDIISSCSSPDAGSRYHDVVVPIFRDPKKVKTRGFANVHCNDKKEKGRKRKAPASTAKRKSKRNAGRREDEDVRTTTKTFKDEGPADYGGSRASDIESFWPLSL